MKKIAHKLTDAASRLDVEPRTLESLRDEGLLITYRLGGVEYLTDHALRDLQHRLEVAHVVEGGAV